MNLHPFIAGIFLILKNKIVMGVSDQHFGRTATCLLDSTRLSKFEELQTALSSGINTYM